MKLFHDDLLSTISHASNRLGPLAHLIDVMVDRLAPRAIALASSGYSPCDSTYTHFCYATCVPNDCPTDSTKNHLITIWSNTINCYHSFESNQCDVGCNC